jgi:glutathione S-transferase
MSDEIVLYTNPMSRGRIVRWMLEEIGRPYRAELLDYGTTMKSAEYLAINPMGKVPAIRHGDTVVTEAAAICAYLADAFPEAGLAPSVGDHARGDYYRWMFFAAGPLEAAVTVRAMGFEVPDDKRMSAGWGGYDDVIETLAAAVEAKEYLAGGKFSAADLYVGSHIGWGMQTGTIAPRPAFEAYVGRLYARPAAVRSDEIDNALAAA